MRLILLLLFTTTVAGAQRVSATSRAGTNTWFKAQTIDFVAMSPALPTSGSEQKKQDVEEALRAQQTQTLTQNYLADNTVLIVRHAEKPPDSAGQTGLTEVGRHRAEAYIEYFRPFREDSMRLYVSALYAGADSSNSVRPRLTLEPISKASGMALNAAIGTKDPESLLALLRTSPHGNTPLICWRHGQIPALLAALGAAPLSLLPDGKWPDDVFDWVIVLHFDAQGRLTTQKLVHESLHVD